jgi:hypothetical protein
MKLVAKGIIYVNGPLLYCGEHTLRQVFGVRYAAQIRQPYCEGK